MFVKLQLFHLDMLTLIINIDSQFLVSYIANINLNMTLRANGVYKMTLFSKIALLTGSLFLSTIACSQSPIPEQCPSVDQIRAEGFSHVEMVDSPTLWTLAHESQYGSPFTWEFILMLDGPNTEEEAILEGNKVLKKLAGNPEPERISGTWGCMYDMEPEFMAFATVKNNYR